MHAHIRAVVHLCSLQRGNPPARSLSLSLVTPHDPGLSVLRKVSIPSPGIADTSPSGSVANIVAIPSSGPVEMPPPPMRRIAVIPGIHRGATLFWAVLRDRSVLFVHMGLLVLHPIPNQLHLEFRLYPIGEIAVRRPMGVYRPNARIRTRHRS